MKQAKGEKKKKGTDEMNNLKREAKGIVGKRLGSVSIALLRPLLAFFLVAKRLCRRDTRKNAGVPRCRDDPLSVQVEVVASFFSHLSFFSEVDFSVTQAVCTELSTKNK